MNKIKAIVKEVLKEPYKTKFGWKVKVKYEDMGGVGETTLLNTTKEQAESIEEGSVFHH